MESESNINSTAIAIIGMSCRFPQAKTPEAFWQNLRDGVECVKEFSREDLESAGVDPSIINYPSYVNTGVILEDLECFDAPFFDFSAREAEILDPQQRIFLECAWEALENAGYDTHFYKGLIGIYGGVDMSTYEFRYIYSNEAAVQSISRDTIKLGNDKDYLTARVAQRLNLKGPAVTVQTTCSTSAIAIIQACQSLLNYQCDIALAGGSAITLPQNMGYFYQEGGISSPDGHCRTFDAQARGTIGGSGAGIVVLKRLEEALKEGDHIEAVICGFGINNDGSGKVGFTAPSIAGQAEAIAAAQAMADVDAESITYIEAHGTGTPMGDPIEIGALTQVFRRSTSKKGFCGIGSVKTNIGHCNSAAGVAGIIKAVLSLKNKMLAPSLHFTRPNPNIDFANSPFYVVDKLKKWDTLNLPRRAGVSSFGIGGTNGHIVLEEAPLTPASGVSRNWQLVLLSAKTPDALDTLAVKVVDLLTNAIHQLPDVAYTLQTGRRRFAYRRMFLLPNEGAITAGDLSQGIGISNNGNEDRKSVVFIFPGEGSQYVNMGIALYRKEPLFMELVDYCCEQLNNSIALDLREVLYREDENPSAGERLKDLSLALPALFVTEYALARLWISWGIKPEAVIGHGIGELVAACIAGVFSLKDGLQLVAGRSRRKRSMPAVETGSMEKTAPFNRRTKSIGLKAPTIPFFSGFTGDLLSDESAIDPAYWEQEITSSAQFSETLAAFQKNPSRIFIEVGPGNSLCTMLGKHYNEQEPAMAFPSLPSHDDRRPNEKVLFNTLGQLWLEGVDVDWRAYYEHEKRNKVALPTYPFERRRYWIDSAWKATNGTLPESKEDISQWLYKPYWKLSSLPSETYRDNLIPFTLTWLIFSNGKDMDTTLITKLRQQKRKVYTVLKRNKFIEIDEFSFGIDPARSDHYSLLLQRLLSMGALPDTIIHLWSFDELNNIANFFEKKNGMHYPDVNGHVMNSGQVNSHNSLLYLAQALRQNNITYPLQLKFVSNHLHQLHELEMVDPQKAMLLGACKVIAHEFPNVDCQNVDISIDFFTPNASDLIIDQLTEEFAFTSPERVILYRNGRRWVQSFKPVVMHREPTKSLLHKGGTYLVTSGTEGPGWVLAKYIAETYKANLVLTSHSAFPSPEGWDNYISTHPYNDAISQKLLQFQELKQAGAEVLIVTADVADRKQVEHLSAQIKDRFDRLQGIIHAAGVVDGDSITIKKESRANKVTDAKVKGALNLQEVFGNSGLDFFVLFSSLVAIVGRAGQMDSCAANNFLDAFARQKNACFGTRYVSINWDTWVDEKGGVDAELKSESKQQSREALHKGIHNHEAVKLFERILSSHLPQVIVSTSELVAMTKK